MALFDDLSDGVKKVFLAGVGAMAIGAEKSQELVDELIKKGELTVEQGKELNEELTRKVKETTDNASDEVLKAHFRTMSPEQRAEWLARAARIAEDLEAEDVEDDVVVEEVEAEPVAEEPVVDETEEEPAEDPEA